MLDSRLTATSETVAATIAREASQYSAAMKVTAIPGGLALFLSLVGIYGLAAFAAAQRTQEIGVRVAFGARPGEVLGLFLRSLQRPFLAAAAGGIVLAMVSTWRCDAPT